METEQEIGWVPTPSFLYRNYIYTKLVKKISKNSFFLDVGTGNGYFLNILANLGFKGESIDVSKKAVIFAKKKFKTLKGIKIKQGDIFTCKPKKKYDTIFCFEVLEHIKDDKAAIKKLYSILDYHGFFIMSVPAHMKDWLETDTIKGHYRRYERNELKDKLENAGFHIKQYLSYGFPLLSVIQKMTAKRKHLRIQTKHLDKVNRDARGKESSLIQEYNPKLRFLFNSIILFPFFKFMDIFLKTDLGLGYIIVAKK